MLFDCCARLYQSRCSKSCILGQNSWIVRHHSIILHQILQRLTTNTICKSYSLAISRAIEGHSLFLSILFAGSCDQKYVGMHVTSYLYSRTAAISWFLYTTKPNRMKSIVDIPYTQPIFYSYSQLAIEQVKESVFQFFSNTSSVYQIIQSFTTNAI